MQLLLREPERKSYTDLSCRNNFPDQNPKSKSTEITLKEITKVRETSGKILSGDLTDRLLALQRQAASNHMLSLKSNRPLEVLRDLVLAHVLGQVPDPQVPRLAHHPVAAAADPEGLRLALSLPSYLIVRTSGRGSD